MENYIGMWLQGWKMKTEEKVRDGWATNRLVGGKVAPVSPVEYHALAIKINYSEALKSTISFAMLENHASNLQA
jgi:hypothetical protein